VEVVDVWECDSVVDAWKVWPGTGYKDLIFFQNQCHCGLVVCGAYALQLLGCRFNLCWLHFQKIKLHF
jgi:hypothetical protein